MADTLCGDGAAGQVRRVSQRFARAAAAGELATAKGLTGWTADLALDLMGLRLLNGAQLGAMLDVSRQAVSSAVKRGTISPPGPDGLFDAKRGARVDGEQ
ncbi:MAG: hypothetical protein WBG85_12445 [Rhodanobacter sp.]